jgi:hypothetical protein
MGDEVSLVVADEFLFFNPEVLPAILPTLATDAMFIIISSIAPDTDSPLRKILETKYDSGRPVIQLLNWIQV